MTLPVKYPDPFEVDTYLWIRRKDIVVPIFQVKPVTFAHSFVGSGKPWQPQDLVSFTSC